MVDIAISDGLSIREWRPDDAASLAKYANNRKIWRNLRDRFPHPYTIDDARGWVGADVGKTPVVELASSHRAKSRDGTQTSRTAWR